MNIWKFTLGSSFPRHLKNLHGSYYGKEKRCLITRTPLKNTCLKYQSILKSDFLMTVKYANRTDKAHQKVKRAKIK